MSQPHTCTILFTVFWLWCTRLPLSNVLSACRRIRSCGLSICFLHFSKMMRWAGCKPPNPDGKGKYFHPTEEHGITMQEGPDGNTDSMPTYVCQSEMSVGRQSCSASSPLLVHRLQCLTRCALKDTGSGIPRAATQALSTQPPPALTTSLVAHGWAMPMHRGSSIATWLQSGAVPP